MKSILNSYTYGVVFCVLAVICLTGCVVVGDWNWIAGFIVGICVLPALRNVYKE